MWTPFNKPYLGAANEFSDKMAKLNQAKPFLFPDLASASKLFLFSDYSGHHKNAEFESYSFFLSNLSNFEIWDELRQELRSRYNLRSSISYKDLTKGHRLRALPEFLTLADCSEGLLATFLVDKELRSLFDVELDVTDPVFNEYVFSKKKRPERTLRVAQFAAFLLAGLSGDAQEIYWFTDQDEIVANEAKLNAFGKIAAKSIDVCVPTGKRRLRLGTTALDDNTLILEDMAAIPDLACGALTEMFSAAKKGYGIATSHVFEPLSSNVSDKCKLVCDWVAGPQEALAKIVFCIGKNSTGQRYFNKLDFQQPEKNSPLAK